MATFTPERLCQIWNQPINIFGNGFFKTMKSKKISQQKIRPKSRYGF